MQPEFMIIYKFSQAKSLVCLSSNCNIHIPLFLSWCQVDPSQSSCVDVEELTEGLIGVLVKNKLKVVDKEKDLMI